MSQTLPWEYEVNGFLDPLTLLPELNFHSECYSSNDCLVLYKTEIKGKTFYSVTNGYLFRLNRHNSRNTWFSEVGEIKPIGWIPMPTCNFHLNKFHPKSKIHDHLQASKSKKRVYCSNNFTSIKEGLPLSNSFNPKADSEPVVVIKQVTSSSGIDFIFTIGRWNAKSSTWKTDTPSGRVVGWLRMPSLDEIKPKKLLWAI